MPYERSILKSNVDIVLGIGCDKIMILKVNLS